MALVSTPLIAPAEVKALLPIRAGNADFDYKIALYIAVATQQIERHTGRFFTRQAMVELFDTANTITADYDIFGSGNESGLIYGARPQRFIMRAYPVDMSVPVVMYYDPTRTFTDAGAIVDPKSYVIREQQGIIMAEFGTGRHLQAIQLSYTGGYNVEAGEANNTPINSLVNVDPVISLACCTQVQFLMSKLHPDNIGMDSDRQKGITTRALQVSKFLSVQGLTKEAAELLSFFKPLAMGRN